MDTLDIDISNRNNPNNRTKLIVCKVLCTQHSMFAHSSGQGPCILGWEADAMVRRPMYQKKNQYKNGIAPDRVSLGNTSQWRLERYTNRLVQCIVSVDRLKSTDSAQNQTRPSG